MIHCKERASATAETAKCGIARHDVHLELCAACQACGPPNEADPNPHLSSAILAGFLTGSHRDVGLATLAREKVLRRQIPDYEEWRKTHRLEPLKCEGEELPRCAHLGAIARRNGCGCWRKHEYQCDAKGLTVIPNNDCPCDRFEEA